MNCVESGTLLEALHDGALNPEAAKRVKEHLSACPACEAELARLRMVSGLLRKSLMPAPSADLDERLTRAFRREYGQPRRPRWRFPGILSGSVSIPKPALVMGALVVVVALAAALKVGMMAATPLVVDMTPPQAMPVAAEVTAPAQPERIKVVEVPVLHEKVRTVYVVSKGGDVRRERDVRGTAAEPHPKDGDPAMAGSVGEKGYFTRANLSGFVPPGEMKARVISGVREDEK